MEQISALDAIGDVVHVCDGVNDATFLGADNDATEISMDDVGSETLEFSDQKHEELLHVVVESASQGGIVEHG